jgi:methylglutaconyl-CoA hydratase
MPRFRFLDVRREGAVEHLILNRPDVRNAFDDEMVAELSRWALDAGADRAVRVVVLSGAGKAFCAGADVAWMARMRAYSEEENLRDARAMSDMFVALDRLPVPLVGRVHGAALGGGTGLAAVCDIVVASDDAVFGFTEVKLGILPAVISPFAVAKIGLAPARELMLTGARFPSAHAKAIGLVHAVVPETALDATVDGYVRELLSSAPSAIAAVKRLLPHVAGRPAADVVDATSRAIASQRVSPEGQEGLSAFLEKRPPRWSS